MWLISRLGPALFLLVYAGVRLRMLASTKKLKNLTTIAFLILVFIFPAAESIAYRGGPEWARILLKISHYTLPVLLYLVLTIVIADLVIGVFRLTGVLAKEKIQTPRFRRFRLGLAFLIPLLVIPAGIWNFRHLRVKDHTVEVPRRSAAAVQLKVVFASDFHLGALTEADFMDRFVALVNAQEADFVLLGGDLLEGDRRGEAFDHFEAQFRRLESKYGVFAVPGNHEGYAGVRDDFYGRAGIRLLRDAVEKIDGVCYLAGRDDGGRSRSRKSIEALLAGLPDDLPLILLDHRPIDLEAVSRTRVDMQFSGHTHHGQLFPINFITNSEYELSWGYKKKGRTHFFVTSGVQLWGPRVRTSGHSEILAVRVKLR